MNHSHFENLIRKSGRESLTDAEREKMRFVLREYLSFKPARSTATPAPRRFFAYAHRPAAMALSVLLIFGVASGGVAYAAEGTLPGDTLYPVKVDVTEPVRTALTFSANAKASWQMTLAERRVTEAATLAQKGELSSSTEAMLAVNFTDNATAAADTLSKQQDKNPDAATVAAASFSARLSGYDQVLAEVSTDSTSTTELQDAIGTQIQGLSHSEIAVAAPRAMAFSAAVSPKTAAPARMTAPSAFVLKLRTSADDALKNSAALIDSASSTLDATTSASARAELGAAAQIEAQGDALLTAGDESGASQAFQDSIAATARLDVLTKTSAQLKINAFGTSGGYHHGSQRGKSAEPTFSGDTNAGSETSGGDMSTSSGEVYESGQDGGGIETPILPTLPNVHL